MIGHIIMMSLAGTVLATEILFDSPNPTEPHQVTKFFTIQYITSTVALSPQTVTETINPTCTITASSIPVCGEASVGIIFTSGGMLPVRQDLTTTESVPIPTSTEIMPDAEAQRNDDEETTTSTATMPTAESQRTDEEETTTVWSLKVEENDMKEETTTFWSVKADKNDTEEEEEGDYNMTTESPHSRLDLTSNEINEDDYIEVETTTIINDEEEDISNDISDDTDSSNSNVDMSIKQDQEMSSVTSTDDTEIMSILNEINLLPQTSTIPLEQMQMTIPGAALQTNDNTKANTEESDTAYNSMATSVQQDLPLSTSYEMATVVMPSCDCASNRQPRNEDMADIITFMTTKTVNTPTVTVTGTTMHTIQYAGCLPEDAVITTSCG